MTTTEDRILPADLLAVASAAIIPMLLISVISGGGAYWYFASKPTVYEARAMVERSDRLLSVAADENSSWSVSLDTTGRAVVSATAENPQLASTLVNEGVNELEKKTTSNDAGTGAAPRLAAINKEIGIYTELRAKLIEDFQPSPLLNIADTTEAIVRFTHLLRTLEAEKAPLVMAESEAENSQNTVAITVTRLSVNPLQRALMAALAAFVAVYTLSFALWRLRVFLAKPGARDRFSSVKRTASLLGSRAPR